MADLRPRADRSPALALGVLAAIVLASACSKARSTASEKAGPECERCHGGGGTPAPPRSVLGFTDTSERGVGAHRRHLEPHEGAVRAPIACAECHVVPAQVAGHYGDGSGAATVTFGGPLAGGRPSTRWNPQSGRCENVYCHGATVSGGDAKDPLWTRVDGSQRTCGSCHGYPPPSHAGFDAAWQCNRCHARTVLPRASAGAPAEIDLATGAHLDGHLDVPSGGACDGCHGAPPRTGAHLAHVQPADVSTLSYGSLAVKEDVSPDGGTAYEFGCGHCHPTDPALHRDGRQQVVLTPPDAPVARDEIKARNAPDAAFDASTGRCNGAYCHSSGQATPAFVQSPDWNGPPGALACDGCHANPPRYASGGAAAADANSHLVLADDGWESGHFEGMPGPWHTSKHGGNYSAANDAAPITCQACHADTVDPAAAGPSGFYWLDTTGDYRLPGGDPARLTDPAQANLQCTACHDGVRAAAGRGRVLPLRHVNGKRDVVFDARTTLGALPFLPEAPNTPTRPYWVTNSLPGLTLPDPSIPDVVMDGATLSGHLGSARYDPATKTCSSVACHLAQTGVTWGAPHGFAACSTCHGM